MSDKPKLQLPVVYDVGYGKPPTTTRFKPGVSGNPNGRPKGKKSKIPPLYEERLKNLILSEAYRDVPIYERGKTRNISMIEANLRSLALNGAKGNNRAANIFTSAVLKIETERKELNSSMFKSALDYKDAWDKELERRKRLGLNLPDPIPHPDDIILDANKGTAHIRGPKTKGELEFWENGEITLHMLYEERQIFHDKLEKENDPIRKLQLEQHIISKTDGIKRAIRVFGPPEIRRTPQYIFDLEDELGIDLTGWTKYDPPQDGDPEQDPKSGDDP